MKADSDTVDEVVDEPDGVWIEIQLYMLPRFLPLPANNGENGLVIVDCL